MTQSDLEPKQKKMHKSLGSLGVCNNRQNNFTVIKWNPETTKKNGADPKSLTSRKFN